MAGHFRKVFLVVNTRNLHAIALNSVASRIGVSRAYAGRIREGYRPHLRHWLAPAESVEMSCFYSHKTASYVACFRGVSIRLRKKLSVALSTK